MRHSSPAVDNLGSLFETKKKTGLKLSQGHLCYTYSFLGPNSLYSLNPFSHGVGHIGHALLWRQIAKQNVNHQNFEKLSIPWKLSCEYFFWEGVPLKTSFYVCFPRQKKSNPKSRSNRPAPVRAWQYVYLYLECRALTALPGNDLPYCAYRSREKGGCT